MIMKQEITYDKLVSTLRGTFPEFADNFDIDTNKITDDNPGVQFSFFVDTVYKNLDNENFKIRLTGLMDKMNNSGDQDVQTILNDFMLDFYSFMKEKGKNIDSLIELLAQETQITYYSNIDLWDKGNKIESRRPSSR